MMIIMDWDRIEMQKKKSHNKYINFTCRLRLWFICAKFDVSVIFHSYICERHLIAHYRAYGSQGAAPH